MHRITIFGLISVLLAVPATLYAQRETGSIAGSIMDASQAAVPGAKVVITDLGTGVEHSVLSNDVGLYVITSLPASRYSIHISRDGFAPQRIPELALQVGQQATFNATLTVG